MNRRPWIVIDSLRGEARLGEVSVPIADAGSSGELQIGGRQGPVLRPLTFGERSRVVARGALSPQPVESICAGVLQLATMQPSTVDQPIPEAVQEILALLLAGADQEQAPSFSETTLLVARATGWSPAQLAEAQAVEVDRLAIHLGNRQRGGWSRITLAGESVDPMTIIRTDLANTLIRRSGASSGDAPQALAAGSTGYADGPGTEPEALSTALPLEEGRPVGVSIPSPHTARPCSPGDGGSSHTPLAPMEMARRTSTTHGDSRRPAPTSGEATAPHGIGRPSTVANRGRSSRPDSQPDVAATDAVLSASPPPGLRLVKQQAQQSTRGLTKLPDRAVRQIRSPGRAGIAASGAAAESNGAAVGGKGGPGISAGPPSSILGSAASAFAAVPPISTSTDPAGAASLAAASALAAASVGTEPALPVRLGGAEAPFPITTEVSPGSEGSSFSASGAEFGPCPLSAPGGNGARDRISEQHALAQAADPGAIFEGPARVTGSASPFVGSLAELADLSDVADALGNLLHDEADLRGIER